MKSGAVTVKIKKPRATKKRATPSRKKAVASISLSSPVISKKGVWKNSFAPKRVAWYEPFYTRQIDTHTGISTIVAVSVFLFGMVFSINALQLKSVQNTNSSSSEAKLSAESGPLQQNVAYVTQLMHVPGAYVDTSVSPPRLTEPMGPVTEQTREEVLAFIPLFKQSLAETTALAFDTSFGGAARVFVGSVNEMGAIANKTVAEEFNLAAAFSALKNTVTFSQ